MLLALCGCALITGAMLYPAYRACIALTRRYVRADRPIPRTVRPASSIVLRPTYPVRLAPQPLPEWMVSR